MGNCISYQLDCVIQPDSYYLPKNLDYKTLPHFIPPINSGRVVKVYDGDTITVASKINGLKKSPIYKFQIRLNGIDTPEIKTKNQEEKEIALKIRDILSDKILGKDIVLKNIQTEKYGRLLCEIYLNKIHINQWLIDQKYAVPYKGGKKNSPESWGLYSKL